MKVSEKDRWIAWSQHFCGYKPRRVGTYYSKDEANSVTATLNDSPSGQWFIYSVEFRPAREKPEAIALARQEESLDETKS